MAIPENQPLLGRCGKCGAWCVYAWDSNPNPHHVHQRGLLLAGSSRRGGAWAMLPDGTYRQNRDPARWGAAAHRCPPLFDQSHEAKLARRRAMRAAKRRAQAGPGRDHLDF